VSEGVNRKPGSKSSFFLVAAIFLLPVSYGRPPLALAGFLVVKTTAFVKLKCVGWWFFVCGECEVFSDNSCGKPVLHYKR